MEQEEAARLAREEEERIAREAAEAQAAAQTASTSAETGNPPSSVFMNGTPEPQNTQPVATETAVSSDKGGIFSILAGFGLDYTQRIVVIAGVGIFVLGLILLIVALSMRRHRTTMTTMIMTIMMMKKKTRRKTMTIWSRLP